MNTFPILDERTIHRRRGREYVKPQESSFWLDVPSREGFTARAAEHFAAMAPPQTLGVEFLAAKKHGVIY